MARGIGGAGAVRRDGETWQGVMGRGGVEIEVMQSSETTRSPKLNETQKLGL